VASLIRLIASLTAIACWLALAATLAVWTFPLKGAPLTTQNTSQSQQMDGSSKFVVADLRMDGDVQDADAVRARILKGLEGREFDNSNLRWLDEMGVNIRADFQDRGYFKVVVDNLQAQPLDPEKHRMLVTFHVDEGEQYRAGDISFGSDNADRSLVIPESELRQQFQLRTGDLFNADQVRSGFDRLKRLYGAQGYADVTVTPNFSVSDKNRSIAITIHVHEGNQYHVGSFDVRGLDSKTKELLEARMQPGSLFNGPLLKALFDQGKATIGANVSLGDVVHVKRNAQAGTVDVLLDFPVSAAHTN
jgi:outer membrane translocation and assembly module TamA